MTSEEKTFSRAVSLYKSYSSKIMGEFRSLCHEEREIFVFKENLLSQLDGFRVAYWNNLDEGLGLINDVSVLLAGQICSLKELCPLQTYEKIVDVFMDMDELIKMTALRKNI